MQFTSYYLGSGNGSTYVDHDAPIEAFVFAVRYDSGPYVIAMRRISGVAIKRYSREEAYACEALAKSLSSVWSCNTSSIRSTVVGQRNQTGEIDMGKKKNNKSAPSNVEQNDDVEQTIEASDVEAIEAADADAPADDASADTAADDAKPAKVKTWLAAQIERMRRAVQHNNLTAQVVRANHEIAGMTEKEADAVAKKIEMHTKAARELIETFIGKIPEAHEGITPSKTGERQSPRNLLAGVKVTLKPEAIKSFGVMFSAEELADLTVVAASGKFVRLSTPSKSQLTIESKNILSTAAPVVAAA